MQPKVCMFRIYRLVDEHCVPDYCPCPSAFYASGNDSESQSAVHRSFQPAGVSVEVEFLLPIVN
jgi:hypothetical protein